ncbi:hypothetical protein LC55x_1633 [Lysobacter capsici]|uniref:hypothetical protein n=1 Tax=Lysobacter capsici TaxID=435897 RepID=UPI0007227914|nr:hypothetical protein [Lysobacter capsici]ALN84923.1 hypothetical protein LC55x_1633 [Lysobacter capsici]
MTDLLPEAPRPPRVMKQPSKDELRDQLAAAKAENDRLTALVDQLHLPWWRRLYLRFRSKPKTTEVVSA